MQIGFIGLGKMGSRMVTKLVADGFEVHVWNRSPEPLREFEDTPSANSGQVKVKIADSIGSLVSQLESPKVIWIMVSHQGVEEILNELKKYLVKGDIIIDGGNSNYKDTDRRFEEFEKAGINFLGIGTSGGIIAIENGYPFMVGGSFGGYKKITPILDSLSKPNGGHEYFGKGGAGHFIKMIHNGVEYGMMQSIGEGFEILERSGYKLDLTKVASLWQKGTIVSGFLTDRAAEMLKLDPKLDAFAGVISRSGEGDWTIEAAKEEGVSAPSIQVAVDYRMESEGNENVQNSFTARMINALRMAFGGHKIRS